MRIPGRWLLALRPVHVEHLEGVHGLVCTGVSTDSRTVAEGDLFVAVQGERFDGHEFLAQAFERGARAAIVAHGVTTGRLAGGPLIVVENTIHALGRLARMHRDRFSIPVLAIAGSNGKTTTKEMIAAVLGVKYTVLRTSGNLNNHIGVPHTLFGLSRRHQIAVVEIGTNHPGEIAYLCTVLNPTHGLVTTIGKEHLEFFGSIEGVAKEEGALYAYLASTGGGTAFINGDDPRLVALAAHVRKRFTFGFSARGVRVKGRSLRLGQDGCASFQVLPAGRGRKYDVRLGIPGSHNAQNALAAAALGHAFRVPAARIREMLAEFAPVSKRMEVMTIAGVTILNDSYNANPDSMMAALHTLAQADVAGKRIAVLGDMRELGEYAAEEHRRVGAEVSQCGVEYLLTCGELGRLISQSADVRFAAHYDQKNILAEYLAELVTPGDMVLIKGSRGMVMEDIVIFLVERLRAVPSAAS